MVYTNILCFCLATHILLAKAGHIASMYFTRQECVIFFQKEASKHGEQKIVRLTTVMNSSRLEIVI